MAAFVTQTLEAVEPILGIAGCRPTTCLGPVQLAIGIVGKVLLDRPAYHWRSGWSCRRLASCVTYVRSSSPLVTLPSASLSPFDQGIRVDRTPNVLIG